MAQPDRHLWPARCAVLLAHARLSQRSLGKAQRLGVLIREAAQGITLVLHKPKRRRARAHPGCATRGVTGSIKFDVVVPQRRWRWAQPACRYWHAAGAAVRQHRDGEEA